MISIQKLQLFLHPALLKKKNRQGMFLFTMYYLLPEPVFQEYLFTVER